ncbi:phage tail protein [Pseudomonas spirodelae]|uniref:Phage tail protein n=1 Tax=Pseudomonas spirodelae TaxID=3101751 RepID=A0ABU5P9D4_9PSED|nr:phage tail protein [Pseudomonas sp. T5W1]MEA1606148.1 phage tail protein [Pseudomonas sp. T5W1]
MSQTYFAILTAVGEAKLANATALGTQLQISRMAVGDGNGNLPTPNRSQTALVGEQYRADLNTLQVDPLNTSQIIAELVIPETEGGYWLREMGLYDAAGDLIAVSNCPPSYKPQLAEGSGRTQVLRMVLIVSSTAAVQLKIDPSVVLATRAYADSLITVHQAAADPHKQYKLRGAFTSLSANTLLTAAHEGVIVLDATAGDRTLTLPLNDAAFGIRDLLIRRADNTGNRAKVQASGADKIKFHTHLNAAGYAFLYLMGAGDWWHLRSDGAGGWWPVARRDDSPLGRVSFEASTAIQPGGYGLPHGVIFVRADWPWVWDHAQTSGMLVDDAGRAGFEGCWTRGDGATTGRTPDVRGQFLRSLDADLGVDASRVAGSVQKGTLVAADDVNYDGVGGVHFTLGSDPASFGADAITGGATKYPNVAPAQVAGNSSWGVIHGVARPTNIAYPGRIKLI